MTEPEPPMTLFAQRLLDGLRKLRQQLYGGMDLEPVCVECGASTVLERCDECFNELGHGD